MIVEELRGRDAIILRQFVQDSATINREIRDIAQDHPFRFMMIPGGHIMKVSITSCGQVGWIADQDGYHYVRHDPQNGHPWRPLSDGWIALAQDAATQAGYGRFVPDTCLINRYAEKSKLNLHQDCDEKDYTQPIVSLCLGASATFLFGGTLRFHALTSHTLHHGDCVVWGRSQRLVHHGIKEIFPTETYPFRYNLTFRKAL